MHADFTTIIQCTGIHNTMLWVDIHGYLYDRRWQPMVAIKLSEEWGGLAFLITIMWQMCQDH